MIVAGFGFRESATEASFADALNRAAQGHVVDAFATLEDKAEGLRPFAVAKGVPLKSIAAEDAQAVETLTLSETSLAIKAVGSVAEATALAAAGPGAALIGPRSISADGMATCALARGSNP